MEKISHHTAEFLDFFTRPVYQFGKGNSHLRGMYEKKKIPEQEIGVCAMSLFPRMLMVKYQSVYNTKVTHFYYFHSFFVNLFSFLTGMSVSTGFTCKEVLSLGLHLGHCSF